MTRVIFTGVPASARRAAASAKFPMPTTHSGSRISAVRRRKASQGAFSASRSSAERFSGVRFFPRSFPAMKRSGQKFAAKCSAKKFSGVPKRSRKSPQRRFPLTSERGHAKPSTGFAGCSRGGFPTKPEMPSQSRTAPISPKGTPVCAMPKGPGFMPRKTTRFLPFP